MTNADLGKVYGVTGERIRYLATKGAPVRDADAFYKWWKQHQKKFGMLYWLLMDQKTREDLQRQIDNLTCIDERSRAQPV